jgi:dUTP pyrophosphatase
MRIAAEYPEGFRPSYATAASAGADLRARLDSTLVIGPGERAAVPTGVRLAIPPGYEGQVRPRSGLALQHGVTVLNAPGTIDSDYRGEVQVVLFNTSSEPFHLDNGDRIAQLVIAPVVQAEFVAGALAASERGEGGFGSTGR